MATRVSPDAGLFEAANRHLGTASQGRVHPNPASLDSAHSRQCSVEILGPDTCGEAVFGSICQTNCLRFRVECHDGKNRAKDLVACDFHVFGDTLKDRWLDEEARSVSEAPPPARQRRTGARPRRYVAEDLIELTLIDDGPDLRSLIERIADAN